MKTCTLDRTTLATKIKISWRTLSGLCSVSILCSTLILINGCGFQLRGSVALPEDLREIDVETDNPRDTKWERALERHLSLSGAQITEQASLKLIILATNSSRDVASYTSNGKVAEYSLVEAIEFKLQHRVKGAITSPKKISSRQIFRFKQNNISSADREEQLIRQELMQDVIQKISLSLRQLPPSAFEQRL